MNMKKNIVLIATGTGIGPYLGMIRENNKKSNLHLYWGGRTKASFKLYKNQIETQQKKGNIQSLHLAYSQEQNTKIYVQHLLNSDGDKIAKKLKNKGVIMICGSVAMQNNVLEVLNHITTTKLQLPISFYIDNQVIKTDCY